MKICTIVTEYNAGRHALYDEHGELIDQDEDAITVFDAKRHRCVMVTGRFANCDASPEVWDCPGFTEDDCEWRWPDRLNESWLLPAGEEPYYCQPEGAGAE